MLTNPKLVEIHRFEVEGEKFLLDVQRSVSMKISPVWDEILDLVDGRPSQSVVDRLSARYDRSLLVRAIEQLQKDGLLVPEDKLPVAPRIKVPDRPRIPIRAMDFNISHDCTMWCKYCYGGGGTYRGPRQLMSKEVAKDAVDFFVRNSGRHRRCEIIFFGGEPLMNMEVMRFVVAYAGDQFGKRGKKVRFSLTTNATLLDDEAIEFLNRNRMNVTISLDGDRETHDRLRVFRDGRGTYNHILPRIKRFLESRRGRVPVRATITHYNLEVVDLARHLFDVGFDNVLMSPVACLPSQPYSLTDEEVETLKGRYRDLAHYFLGIIRRKEPKRIMLFTAMFNLFYRATRRVYGCGGGRHYMMVDPVGDLYVCHRCGGEDRLKLGDIYNGIDPQRQRGILENHVDAREDCGVCWARYLCGGGCIANNVEYYGGMSRSDPLSCDLYRHQVQLGMWLYSRVYKEHPESITRYCQPDQRVYMREPEEEQNGKGKSLE
ncbi:MAG TPA: SPASM domain-containing protein [Candidatus Latescibacteria bacterium]|nr:SPASM domain-containing protein [Candidatus Latescibacterota bacterium]